MSDAPFVLGRAGWRRRHYPTKPPGQVQLPVDGSHAPDQRSLDRFESDPSVRVVLIASEGKQFCTGADLDEVQGLRDDKAKLAEFIATGHATLCRLEAVAFARCCRGAGPCALAGGLELMMACDVAFAAAPRDSVTSTRNSA